MTSSANICETLRNVAHQQPKIGGHMVFTFESLWFANGGTSMQSPWELVDQNGIDEQAYVHLSFSPYLGPLNLGTYRGTTPCSELCRFGGRSSSHAVPGMRSVESELALDLGVVDWQVCTYLLFICADDCRFNGCRRTDRKYTGYEDGAG